MKLAYREVLVLCAALGLLPARSQAETNQKAEALRHYDRGLEQMQNKGYGEAIAEFNQAYDLGHDVAVLYDIGLAYTAMDENVLAIKTFKRYLSEGGKRIPAARRKDTEAEIARQEARIAMVIVHAQREDVLIKVDGIEVGKTPLPEGIPLNAGAHMVSASAAGYRTWEQKLDLASGDRRNLDIDLVPGAAAGAEPGSASTTGAAGSSLPAATASTTVASAAAPSPFPTRRVATFVVGAAGIGLLAVGGVYGAQAISKRHDSNSFCPQNQCSQTGVDLNNQAKTAARIADVTIGIGLVGVAVATYLLLTEPARAAAAPQARGPRLLAGLGPGQASLALRGSW